METLIIREKQDLTYLNWSKIRKSSGTAGSFLKATSELGGVKIYYKLSNYDSIRGVIGHESVNELIADRLLTLLGIEHLHYQLIHADILVDGKVLDTYVCASENFRAGARISRPSTSAMRVNGRTEKVRLTSVCVWAGQIIFGICSSWTF